MTIKLSLRSLLIRCAISIGIPNALCIVDPPICTVDQVLEDNVCVDIIDPVVVCDDDQTLVDGECIDNEEPGPIYCVDEPNNPDCIEENLGDDDQDGNGTIVAVIIVGVIGIISAGIVFFRKMFI